MQVNIRYTEHLGEVGNATQGAYLMIKPPVIQKNPRFRYSVMFGKVLQKNQIFHPQEYKIYC